MSQVIVFRMVDLFDQDIITAVVQFLTWYQMACRLREYTEQSLRRMDYLMEMYI